MSVKVRTGGGPIKVTTPDPAKTGEVKLTGTPGPRGAEGPQGPAGSLNAGVIVDGGNF